MSYWFFFSYAHADDDEYLQKFYSDLAKEVKGLTGAEQSEIGFIDRKDIEHGAQWDTTIENGLQSCRVFVPVYSPSYFRSEYCGKEMKIFRDRMQSKLQEAAEPDPLILPVLWNPETNILQVLPESVNKIQYKHGTYPDEYLTEGVSQMVRRGLAPGSGLYDQYWIFIRKFASSLLNAANKYKLPSVSTLTSLDKVKSLFSSATLAPADKSADETGPRYVQFIFVAGKQSEMKAAQRAELKFYGQGGGADWQPYLESYKGNAKALAIEAIEEVSKNLHYEELTLDSEIEKQVIAAAAQDKVVVVMVDTWTLRLESYNKLIEPLDRQASVNCITVVLWNEEDNEADVHKSILETVVNATFSTKITNQEPNFFPTNIKSYETFKKELTNAIIQTQKRIVATAQVREKKAFAMIKTQPHTEHIAKPTF